MRILRAIGLHGLLAWVGVAAAIPPEPAATPSRGVTVVSRGDRVRWMERREALAGTPEFRALRHAAESARRQLDEAVDAAPAIKALNDRIDRLHSEMDEAIRRRAKIRRIRRSEVEPLRRRVDDADAALRAFLEERAPEPDDAFDPAGAGAGDASDLP